MADFAEDESENYLFDMKSGGINLKDTTEVSTDRALGASNNDLTDGYTSYSDVIETGKPYEQTNAAHTVWVTGIQQNADDTVDFVLNDSGTNYGQKELVDYYDFMNAWDDYDNYLTIADA
jgi:hypothetical protein